MITYNTHVKPFAEKFHLVKIEQETITKIDEFVTKLILKKKNESQHQFDNRSHYKRYYTGTLGEVALEKFLDISGIVDWTIGDSKKYHHPDLRNIGVNAGIKTVDYGNFPVIFNQSYSNEIIMIRWKERHIYICGLAKVSILNSNQSIDLIKDEKLRERKTKTGFYGFEHLEKFDNLEELIRLNKF